MDRNMKGCICHLYDESWVNVTDNMVYSSRTSCLVDL